MQSYIISDLDDTLIYCGRVYDRARQQFATFVHARFPGVTPTEAQDLFDAIDLKNAMSVGFGKDRYPKSMLEAFRFFCVQQGRLAHGAEESEVVRIGESVFTSRYEPIEGAVETMEQYRRAGVKTAICTKGDTEVQWSKIKSLGLDEIVNLVSVVPAKGPEEIAAVAAQLRTAPGQVGWMIGDSRRDDIAGGRGAGMKTVLVADPEKPTWSYENGYEGIQPDYTVERVAELPRIIPLNQQLLRRSAR
jgi:putative hydrolase of the HAD superfamily